MNKRSRKILAMVLIFAITVFPLASCAKVVKIGEENKLTGEKTFSAKSNVDQWWDSKAIPELTKEAVDLKTLLEASNGDIASQAEKYGRISSGTTGSASFIVKGAGKVKSVNQEKKSGTMQVSLDDYGGKENIKLQIGTVFMGTSVRDCLSFIKYEDYQNQVQWAAISQSIHKVIQKEVIDPINVSSLTGKTIEFTGCFTADQNDEILITPVKITVK